MMSNRSLVGWIALVQPTGPATKRWVAKRNPPYGY
jgi:hypothetical protein